MAQKPGGFTAGHGLLSAAKTLNFGSGAGQARGQEQAGGSQGSSAEHLNSTSLKLFSSLGLSPSDLDALAQIPEDQISVETLPHILRQLKNRKSHENFPDWNESVDREGPRERDFPYRQEPSKSHSFGLHMGASEDFSRRSDFGMAPLSDSAGYMQGRVGQPSQSKVEDFVGLNPARFPHVCSLCDFDVHSVLEWNQHINGLRHTENRRELLFLYPEWEPPVVPKRSASMDAPNLSAGILGPAPMSSQTSGLSSGWGGGAALSGMNSQAQNMVQRGRVVMVKYERRPLSNKSIFTFVEPFGQLREHLLLKNRAFLEMSSHDEALDVVNYYQQNPASLGGRPLVFEMSNRPFIEKHEPSNPADRSGDRPMDRPMNRPMNRPMDRPMDRSMDRPMDRPMDRGGMNRGLQEVNAWDSQVVYFSNLPREEEKKKDLLTIAGRFGTVEKHLFLQAEGFIQLASPRDAEMMVKYYSMNPLVVRGRQVRLNICTKYKTLNVRQGRRFDDKGSPGNRGGFRESRSSPSPKRSANRRTSPSPKRSTDTKSSSPKRSTAKKTSPSPKTRTKEERKKEERPKSKPTSKTESKVESKPESTSESKPDSKPESKPEPKTESKAEPQDESASDKDEPLSVKPKSESDGETESLKASNGDEHTEDTPEEVGGADGQVQAESVRTEDNMADAEENVESMEADLHEDEEDLMENMDDMVVLDELEDEDGAEASDDSMKGGMCVVVVMGFRKGYNFMKDLLQLAKPFGEVVRHFVLDLRSKAYLQFSTEEEAVAMARFYNGNVQASICGRPVKIYHYKAHPTIQSGRVVYIGQIPIEDYDDEDILKFMEPFGKVSKYFLRKMRRECFIEMSKSEEAEEVMAYYRKNPLMFHGKRLTTYISRKYRELRGARVTEVGVKKASKREKSPEPKETPSDEPAAKKSREEETDAEEGDEQRTEGASKEEDREEAAEEGGDEDKEEAAKEGGDEVKDDDEEEEEHEEQREEMSEEEQKTCTSEGGAQEDVMEERETEDKQEEEEEERLLQDSEHEQDEVEEMETSAPLEPETLPSDSEPPSPQSTPSEATLPLPPYDPDTPLGVEHVEMGYYCHVCSLFYSDEDSAKRLHCSSKPHYNKLQKYLKKRKTAKKKAASH